ncbi:hypothetical protein D1007_54100 [Hordeum vulgare]|nr:hypothetical protein D1007_54100 [Hordeum vulgare]
MGWNSGPSDLLSIVSKKGHQVCDSWTSWADGLSASDAGRISCIATNVCNHYLPPLPPTLDQCVPPGCEFQPPRSPQRLSFWDRAALLAEPYCLPSWAGAQVAMPLMDVSWNAIPEVTFEPGVFRNIYSPLPNPVHWMEGGEEYTRQVWQSVEELRARKALAEANLSGPGLISAITEKVQGLHIDEQQRFIGKIVAIISCSILGAPPAGSASSSRRFKQSPLGAAKASRQSPLLQRMRSLLSSSRRSQADISVRLGVIKRPEEFTDDTLLAYLQFFRAPMPPENVAKLAEIAGLSSPSHLRVPNLELQAVLEELAGRPL